MLKPAWLLRKMTSAASYVTRALLVLGAIMNSLIALKYIAGSKASTVESLGPIGKLFKPEYIASRRSSASSA